MSHAIRHKSAKLNDIEIFYREAGNLTSPAVVLLHGFPASSRYFKDLIVALSGSFRVIAPDYPGFGHSPVPTPGVLKITFDKYATLIATFLDAVGVDRFALCLHDFGAPVGFRIAMAAPQRVAALIVQNGNAYDQGLTPFFDPLFKHWRRPTQKTRAALLEICTLEAIRWQYLAGVSDPSRVDPDNWLLDHTLISRPGVAEVMLDLFTDYQENLALYPTIQAYLRAARPPTCVVWGTSDPIFAVDGARAFLHDLPDAELHLVNSGHFALQDKGEEIIPAVAGFLDRLSFSG